MRPIDADEVIKSECGKCDGYCESFDGEKCLKCTSHNKCALREAIDNAMTIGLDPSDDDFGAVLNCAVRYALGRRSYMPFIVMDFITPFLPYLSNKTIWCFERDLEDCRDFGDPEIDEPEWRKFQAAVKAEVKRREERETAKL